MLKPKEVKAIMSPSEEEMKRILFYLGTFIPLLCQLITVEQ